MDDATALYHAVYAHLPQPRGARLANRANALRRTLVQVLQALETDDELSPLTTFQEYDSALLAISREVAARAFSLGATGDVDADTRHQVRVLITTQPPGQEDPDACSRTPQPTPQTDAPRRPPPGPP